MISDVPPKNLENTPLTPIALANAGIIAIIARAIEPGRVIFEIISSIKLAVACPGLTPGIKPPFFFISSDICFGLTVIAV